MQCIEPTLDCLGLHALVSIQLRSIERTRAEAELCESQPVTMVAIYMATSECTYLLKCHGFVGIVVELENTKER